MILVVDNYDSFVYNLTRYITQLGFETKIVRNNQITIEGIKALQPSAIIISPGPCGPKEAGISISLIQAFYRSIPILGICLGHQAIGAALNSLISRAKRPLHGMSSVIKYQQLHPLFHEIKSPCIVGRYHSLIIEQESLSEELEVIAESEEGEIMAVAHKKYFVYGMQFHPESVLTEQGYQLIANFFSWSGIEKNSKDRLSVMKAATHSEGYKPKFIL